MLYLKRTTDLQPFYLHTTGLETKVWTGASFRLYSTISGERIAAVEARVSSGAEYVEARVALPVIPQGEYRYELLQEGSIVASGLAMIGDPQAIAKPASAGEGIEQIVIKQYGE